MVKKSNKDPELDKANERLSRIFVSKRVSECF